MNEFQVGDEVRVYDEGTRWFVTLPADMDDRYEVTTVEGHRENLRATDLRPAAVR